MNQAIQSLKQPKVAAAAITALILTFTGGTVTPDILTAISGDDVMVKRVESLEQRVDAVEQWRGSLKETGHK